MKTVKTIVSVFVLICLSGLLSADEKILDSKGRTLAERVRPPAGYVRLGAEKDSLASYLRNYPLKPAGSPVLLWDGSRKWNQSAHAAVFELPVERVDLQQCADSVMRIYAEYFLSTGQESRIKFRFTNGFECAWSKWREGFRVSVKGKDVSWVKSAEAGSSRRIFSSYLRTVFSYAGTASMQAYESRPKDLSLLRTGDVFLHGGSPGHVVLVVDVAERNGKKAFLLAQGFMPAQEFHLLKNPLGKCGPWYFADELDGMLVTPEWTFRTDELRELIW